MTRIRKKRIAWLIACVMLCTLLFSACDLFTIEVSGIEFLSDDITLSVDKRIDLSEYVKVTPDMATNKAFTVVSSDPDVVKIETYSAGGVVAKVYAYGVSLGTATLTAVTVQNNKTASATVTVTYAEPTGIAVAADENLTVVDGNVIMQADDVTAATFTAQLMPQSETTGQTTADPESEITWTFKGEQTQLKASESFSVTPSGVGKHTVQASISDKAGTVFTDATDILVYEPLSNVAVEYNSALLLQEENEYKTVSFKLLYDSPDGNPDPIVEWFVGDERAGKGNVFYFTPESAGAYAISVRLNGQAVEFEDGQTQAVVQARGHLMPINIRLDYDNCYPKVFVRWEGTKSAKDFSVSIVNKQTGQPIASDLTTQNTALAAKFTDSSFDATDYFTGGAGTVFTNTYEVKVKTLADASGVLTESAWSAPHLSKKVDTAAKPYLSKRFYDGARNYYISDADEFFEWVEYAMLWRPAAALTENGETLYMDYDYGNVEYDRGDSQLRDNEAMRAIWKAVQKAPFTGRYSYGGRAKPNNKKLCDFAFTFETVNVPTKYSGEVYTHDEAQWNAIRPHVNYKTSARRNPNTYKFPIDTRTPVTVETSEQLYYVTTLGYKPVPKAGSSAEALYSYARRTLCAIITDDMTDVDKLHAIYDWIMWRVLYDQKVLQINALTESVKYESYYLESVLTDAAGRNYGVCDAMSKAYALLSNMEGIECLRVIGQAGTGGSRGGHAWNKVKLGGNWYVVDCTWGDAQIQVLTGGAVKEAATHEYFLVTDAMIRNTHVEEDGITYPATADKRYPWYDEVYAANGAKVDLHVDSKAISARNAEVAAIVEYMLADMQTLEPNYKVGISDRGVYAEYYGYEFVVDRFWKDAFNSQIAGTNPLVDELAKSGLNLGTHYYLFTKMCGEQLHVQIFFASVD